MPTAAAAGAVLKFMANKQCKFLLGVVRDFITMIQQITGQIQLPMIIPAKVVATNVITLQQLDLIKYLYTAAYGSPYPKDTPTSEEQSQIDAIYNVLKIPIPT
jgi:hypothetical protein